MTDTSRCYSCLHCKQLFPICLNILKIKLVHLGLQAKQHTAWNRQLTIWFPCTSTYWHQRHKARCRPPLCRYAHPRCRWYRPAAQLCGRSACMAPHGHVHVLQSSPGATSSNAETLKLGKTNKQKKQSREYVKTPLYRSCGLDIHDKISSLFFSVTMKAITEKRDSFYLSKNTQTLYVINKTITRTTVCFCKSVSDWCRTPHDFFHFQTCI